MKIWPRAEVILILSFLLVCDKICCLLISVVLFDMSPSPALNTNAALKARITAKLATDHKPTEEKVKVSKNLPPLSKTGRQEKNNATPTKPTRGQLTLWLMSKPRR